jgi:cell division protein FtsB
MPRAPKTPAPTLSEELTRVGADLRANECTTAERMELLRRQAELGDLKDALEERARRAGK